MKANQMTESIFILAHTDAIAQDFLQKTELPKDLLKIVTGPGSLSGQRKQKLLVVGDAYRRKDFTRLIQLALENQFLIMTDSDLE